MSKITPAEDQRLSKAASEYVSGLRIVDYNPQGLAYMAYYQGREDELTANRNPSIPSPKDQPANNVLVEHWKDEIKTAQMHVDEHRHNMEKRRYWVGYREAIDNALAKYLSVHPIHPTDLLSEMRDKAIRDGYDDLCLKHGPFKDECLQCAMEETRQMASEAGMSQEDFDRQPDANPM